VSVGVGVGAGWHNVCRVHDIGVNQFKLVFLGQFRVN
jgi:hypothetical protein